MTLRVLFSEEDIRHRVSELAAGIAKATPPEVLMVGILKGCFVFMADLARALDALGHRPRVEFIRFSSYGLERESSGEARLVGAVPEGIAGESVLLVDDIVDTGRSLRRGRETLLAAGAGSVSTCVLLDKVSRREVPIEADFVGFEVPDVFVAGYGIDCAEQYRHLPYIGAVD